MKTIIAVDIGGTQLRVGVYPVHGQEPIRQKRISTTGPGSAVERLISLIKELWPEGDEVLAISAGAPGQVDPEAGVIVAAPNIAGWVDLHLKCELEDNFHVPIYLNNDANLAALGEWQFGAAQGHHDVFYITVSTGIGGGVILRDNLLLGIHGLAAEVGHVVIVPDGPPCSCGQRGHLEAFSSGTGIAKYFNDECKKGRSSSLSSGCAHNAKQIAEAARAGDPLALEAFKRAAYYLGISLANYLHLFNPSIVVIGGGVSRSGDFFWKPMRETIDQFVLSDSYTKDLKILPAALGDDCGLLGALAIARTNLKL